MLTYPSAAPLVPVGDCLWSGGVFPAEVALRPWCFFGVAEPGIRRGRTPPGVGSDRVFSPTDLICVCICLPASHMHASSMLASLYTRDFDLTRVPLPARHTEACPTLASIHSNRFNLRQDFLACSPHASIPTLTRLHSTGFDYPLACKAIASFFQLYWSSLQQN